ncbi:DHA2 family efflux MFS transporter permease subunit [Sideroxydans lithotrophicus]|uniref:Drug resistance transporter, EmrB/QacA subfamily n=1 Tax=Sideroxydans lithotrophicus (strain ES-1) TaxID=580332 RepID=D5CRF8_SIDLE|nr:DHA2 family efflux MFS transporter permease subunit [Sideroxydans lithotrophicus]ADE11544.1 drug resistance transporter, EmrB/QacA subfamily [Sideroxydans lithotrophicus ES-1]
MNSNRVLTGIAVMAATIMQVLDTTIINVALPNMIGQLDATPDNISWVLTSYLIASAIIMPLTGFITDRIGQKRFLLISIAGFVVSSALCGMATSLAQMVLFRFLQGVFGASLVPLSQSIMLQIFPGEQRGKAMAIWSMGVMVAPIMGPTLGGWLTEQISWRWTFYINLPVGILSFILAMRHVHDTPTRERRMDWLGFASLGLGIGALQLILDRGNQDDWFSSQTLVFAALLSVAAFIFFIVYTLTGKHHPLFDLRIFRDRNYLVASLIMTTIGIGFFGGMLLQSLFLQNFLGYPTFEAGLYMAPRGLASFLVMIFVGKFVNRIQPRNFIFVGICASILGNYMMTRFTGDITANDLIVPMMLQGMGMGLIFVPISTLAFTTLPKETAAEAAGIYSLIRAVGSSFGIAILATYFSRSTQQSWSLLRGDITPYSEALRNYLAPLHLGAQDPQGVAMAARAVLHQAQNIGYIDSFWFATLNFVMMLPLLLLVRTPKKGAAASAPAVSAE